MQPTVGTGKPSIVEKVKSHIPGTPEHAMTHPQTATGHTMAPTATGTGYGTTGMTHTPMGTGTMGTGMGTGHTHGVAPHGESRAEYAVKSAIPGQPEHVERHGYTANDAKAQNVVQQVKAHLPGTREHEAHKAMQGRAPY